MKISLKPFSKLIQSHLEVMHRLTLGNYRATLVDPIISVILILQTLCFKMLSLQNYKKMKIKLILLFQLRNQLECILMKNLGKNNSVNCTKIIAVILFIQF